MFKLTLLLFVSSLCWLVPNHFRIETIKTKYNNLSDYQEAVFIVDRAIDYGKIRGHSYPSKSYLQGHLEQEPNVVEFFDDEQVYKIGELQKKYPVGTRLAVLFNSSLKDFENGQSLRVIKKENLSVKIERLSWITYGPFGASIILILLNFFIRPRKN